MGKNKAFDQARFGSCRSTKKSYGQDLLALDPRLMEATPPASPQEGAGTKARRGRGAKANRKKEASTRTERQRQISQRVGERNRLSKVATFSDRKDTTKSPTKSLSANKHGQRGKGRPDESQGRMQPTKKVAAGPQKKVEYFIRCTQCDRLAPMTEELLDTFRENFSKDISFVNLEVLHPHLKRLRCSQCDQKRAILEKRSVVEK